MGNVVNRIKYYLYAGTAIIGAIGMGILVMYKACTSPPPAKRTIGVKAIDGFEEETKAAMDIWNDFVGCEFFVDGDDVLVKSDDGEPCGDPWRPHEEGGHAGTAYRCPDGRFEILISHPGTVWMQTKTIGHELGHALYEYGVEHNSRGIMSHTPIDDGGRQPQIVILDRDVDAISREFCK